jgi:fucose permease
VADLIIAQRFAQKEYRFFARWLIALALLFPMSLLFMPAHPLTLLVAMAIWGIYYEFISFSQFNFVHRIVKTDYHAAAWGVLEIFKALGGMLAPIAATYLLEWGMEVAMWVVIGSLTVGAVLFVVYRWWYPTRPVQAELSVQPVKTKRSFWQEMKIWGVLMKRIWPMYIFFFAFVLLESAFWTLGPLLSEEIREVHPWSGFLLTAFILPSVFAPLLVHPLSTRYSKKKISFLAALLGSALLAVGAFWLGNSAWLIVIVFLSAIFFSLDFPEIAAVFEDYLSRIDGYENDLIGLQGTSTSLSYILGPALAGALANWLGNSAALGVFAVFLGLTSAWLLLITPRKIKMPRQELAAVEVVPVAS